MAERGGHQGTVTYQCLFCGAGIAAGEHDPCAIVVVAGIDRPRAAQKEQTFYCHLGCLRARASVHPGTFYIAEPDFPTVGQSESDGACAPETHGRASGTALEISDQYELLALHRAIMEAKFHDDPDSVDVPGSPLLARVSEQVVGAPIESERAHGRKAEALRWERWRTEPRVGRFWGVAVSHGVRDDRWASSSTTQRAAIARALLAPFRVDDSVIEQFIAEVQSLRGTQLGGGPGDPEGP